MTALRTILSFLCLMAVAVNGFSPVNKPATIVLDKSTALSFGFLKELGLEKPSWLPDFGSKKEEPAPAAEPADGESEDADATEEE
jgi:hypothetical protein